MNVTRNLVTALAAAGALSITLFAATPAAAGARSTVKVVNNSSYTVLSIRSSPVYRTGYGRTDLLGQYLLRPGYNISVDFDTADAENECLQDVIAESTSGQRWQRRMNICTTTTWTLGD